MRKNKIDEPAWKIFLYLLVIITLILLSLKNNYSSITGAKIANSNAANFLALASDKGIEAKIVSFGRTGPENFVDSFIDHPSLVVARAPFKDWYSIIELRISDSGDESYYNYFIKADCQGGIYRYIDRETYNESITNSTYTSDAVKIPSWDIAIPIDKIKTGSLLPWNDNTNSSMFKIACYWDVI